jgi:hypothetical protein
MAALKPCLKITYLALVCFGLLFASRAEEPSFSLYAQATSTMLNRSFPSLRAEYLLTDLRTGQIIAIRWRNAEKPIPVGSLLKPFVALSYSELHSPDSGAAASSLREFPRVYCQQHLSLEKASCATNARFPLHWQETARPGRRSSQGL